MVDLSSSLCKRLPEGIYLLFWKYLSTLKNRKTVHPSIQSTQQSIQGSFNPSEKYDCHLGLLFPIYGKPCSKPQKNRINLSIYLIHLAALDILNQLCFHGYWRYVGLIHWHNWGEFYPLPVFFMVLIGDFYGFIIPFPWGYICVSGHNCGQFAWKKSNQIANFPKNRDPSKKHRNLLNPNWDFMKGCGSNEPRFCRSFFSFL